MPTLTFERDARPVLPPDSEAPTVSAALARMLERDSRALAPARESARVPEMDTAALATFVATLPVLLRFAVICPAPAS